MRFIRGHVTLCFGIKLPGSRSICRAQGKPYDNYMVSGSSAECSGKGTGWTPVEVLTMMAIINIFLNKLCLLQNCAFECNKKLKMLEIGRELCHLPSWEKIDLPIDEKPLLSHPRYIFFFFLPNLYGLRRRLQIMLKTIQCLRLKNKHRSMHSLISKIPDYKLCHGNNLETFDFNHLKILHFKDVYLPKQAETYGMLVAYYVIVYD